MSTDVGYAESETKEDGMHLNINSPLWRFITTCVRFAILNILFVLTLIPVVTLGPARAALYSTVFAYTENDDIDLGRQYLIRFKREFLRAIGSSLIFLVLAAAILFSLVFWASSNSGIVESVSLPVLIVAAVITGLTYEYYFPLQARYQNGFTQTWKNAFMLPWRAWSRTLLLVAIDTAAVALFVFSPPLRVAFILLGFSWLAYAKSLIFLWIFNEVDGPTAATRH